VHHIFDEATHWSNHVVNWRRTIKDDCHNEQLIRAYSAMTELLNNAVKLSKLVDIF